MTAAFAVRAVLAALGLSAAVALAQVAAPPPPVAQGAKGESAAAPARAQPATAPAAGAATPSAATIDSPDDDATLTLLNRPVVVLRAPFLGASPKQRVAAARERLRVLFFRGGEDRLSLEDAAVGVAVLVDNQLAFFVTHEDAAPVPGATARSVAEDATKVLEQLARETREARDSKFLFGAAIHAAIATAVLLTLLWLAYLLWRVSSRWLMSRAIRFAPSLRVSGGELLPRERAVTIVRRSMTLLWVVTILLLGFQWLGYVLSLFPYTRPWSEGLFGFLVNTSVGLLESVARALPSLFVAVVIFVIAWAINRIQRRFFDRVVAHGMTLGSIDRDTAPPTRRLATMAIWVFAAVMAYPYIPGSDTEAFKGLSVLLGVMVSVGASGIVGQAVSGLILMYTRTFRTGEYVRIGDREGTMTRLGMFTSTIHTGLGEELTMPNSQVLTSVTTNFSRILEGPGFMMAAKVSIGYDAPWRQVHAMLIEAAHRTDGILDEPPPRVFQTSLDDFYVQYRLVCQASPLEPLARAKLVTALNAAIQDVFNEHGVQIMSPHYLGDPAAPKVVARERWYAAPAKPGGGESRK